MGLGELLEKDDGPAIHDQRGPCELWCDYGIVGQAILRDRKGMGNRT